MSFSRPTIQGHGPDGIWAEVETQPISLRAAVPVAGQHLNADLQTDSKGYTLRVTRADGQPASG